MRMQVALYRPMWPGSARPCISAGPHVLPATTRAVARGRRARISKAGSKAGYSSSGGVVAEPLVFIGIDVAQATLEVAARPTGAGS
jgi:hypothetical protein